MTDDDGAVTAEFTYDTYGQVQTATESVAMAYRYTGRHYDPLIGLYHYRMRDFDPSTGPFLQDDSM